MRKFGIDLSTHRSARLSQELVRGADLIMTMTRDHVRAVIEVDAESWPRTFPLNALVRRITEVGPRDSEPFDWWVAQLHVGRSPRDVLVDDAADDISDPVDLPLREHERTAAMLERLIDQVVFGAFPAPLIDLP
jgi:protein-tyrosine phosphatase